MELYDFTEPAGISAATTIIIEVLKKLFISFELKQYTWYPALLNLAILIISFGLSFLTIRLFGIDWITALGNGILCTLLAIGGYEMLVNVLRGLFFKRK